MIKLLKELSNLRGVSGFEHLISDKISEYLTPYADEVYKDNLGNIIAVKKCGHNNAASVMIEGHMDEIGLMVKNIDENGFITFTSVGGIDTRILPSLEVIIHGKKDIPGVIGAKPPHLQNSDEAKKSMKITDMAIDCGMSYENAKKYINVGDSITMATKPEQLSDKYFSGKTLDDRAGICAVINVLKNLENSNLNVDLYVVCAVCEEVGLRGATTATYGINPDIAIAIDVCHGITPDNSDDAFNCGDGTVISIGPNLHPKLSDRLIATAKAHDIKIQTAVESGNTGTDAWAIQVSREGIPTGLLSIPLKYMHTCVETLNLDDIEATANVLTHFISELNTAPEDWLCF